MSITRTYPVNKNCASFVVTEDFTVELFLQKTDGDNMNIHDAVVIGFYMHALKTDGKTGNARRAEQLQACIQLRVLWRI